MGVMEGRGEEVCEICIELGGEGYGGVIGLGEGCYLLRSGMHEKRGGC
jgi:hypothetical protein